MENRNDRRDTDRRLRRRAVELLVEGDLRTAQIVLATVTGRSLQVSLPPMVAMVVASGSADELDDAMASLEERAGKVRPLVAARVEDELWLVAPARATASAAESLVAMGLHVGVGSTVRIEDTGRSRAAATHALAQTTDTTRLVQWAEIVDHGILALVGQEVAASFADTFLGPLSTRVDLKATLQSFLRHHGSRGQVARELGVHRNTVRKRIEEIEEAVGRSLDDPQVRVSAWVALQVEAARELSE